MYSKSEFKNENVLLYHDLEQEAYYNDTFIFKGAICNLKKTL